MKNLLNASLSAENEVAHKRLHSVAGDPFLFANWERVLFCHFAIAPELLRPLIHPPLELDLDDGHAYVSIVAVTMKKFRPAAPLSPGWALVPIAHQQFLNLRTYVHHRDEPGAFFLWGWLSKPIPLPLPTFNLPCAFAKIDYRHLFESGQLSGSVTGHSGQFIYHASIDPKSTLMPCSSASVAEFAMERYSGFFGNRSEPRVFRAWHPTWLQTDVEATIDDDCLITKQFAWFKQAKFVGANFAPGFEHVALGQAHAMENVARNSHRHGPSGLFEMP